MSYVGKPLKLIPGESKNIYGWQGLYRQTYPELGNRWMANCDIPDLDLFPTYYGIKHIQFSAGLESNVLHLILWVLSWMIRSKLPINLEKHAQILLKISNFFDRFGSYDGGMHMILSEKDKKGNPKTIKWFIIAKNNEGPFIPVIPAIILTKKLIQNELNLRGAFPCMNLISLEEYLSDVGFRSRFQFFQKTVSIG